MKRMTMVISFEICDGGRLGYKLDQIGIGLQEWWQRK